MAKRKGKVSKIGKSKYSYYLQLDGDGFYFNTKFNPSKVGVGDVVGIEFDPKGDTRGQVQAIKLLEDNGGPKGHQESGGDFGGGNRGGNASGDGNRQESIVYQSSRKDALVLTGLLVEQGAIALPKAADKRRTIIEELLAEQTNRLFKDAMDPSKAVKGAEEVEEDSGGDDWDEAPKDDGGEDWDDDTWE